MMEWTETVRTAVAALNELYSAVGAPNRLSDIGFPDDGAELVVDRILEVAPPSNPMPLTRRSAPGRSTTYR